MPFFGIRGFGSVYYLAYAAPHAHWQMLDELWSRIVFTLLVYTVVDGVTATPIARLLDRTRLLNRRRRLAYAAKLRTHYLLTPGDVFTSPAAGSGHATLSPNSGRSSEHARKRSSRAVCIRDRMSHIVPSVFLAQSCLIVSCVSDPWEWRIVW